MALRFRTLDQLKEAGLLMGLPYRYGELEGDFRRRLVAYVTKTLGDVILGQEIEAGLTPEDAEACTSANTRIQKDLEKD